MSATIDLSVTLSPVTCGECGMTYAIPQRFREQCRQEGKCWKCPNPRCNVDWGFVDGENTRLKKDLAAQRAETDRLRRLAVERAEALHKAEQRATRARKRAAAGVCPCCKRTVSQMARHMKSKHPGYAP